MEYFGISLNYRLSTAQIDSKAARWNLNLHLSLLTPCCQQLICKLVLLVNLPPKRGLMPTIQETVTSTISWFEIPAADFARAIQFYETILGAALIHQAAWPNLAIFPYQKPGISGAIGYGEGFKPAADGVIIYLNCDGKFDSVLKRVEGAGGT